MIKEIHKKSICGLLSIAIFLAGFGFPQKASAQLSTLEVNSAPNLFQQIAQTFSNAASAASEYSIEWKEYVLDPLASGLAKTVIKELTADIVDWINNGFEGSPAFVTNPGGRFLDIADQVTGDFLAKHGGPLAELCSPFSIDIRLALAFKYHPKQRTRYKCTLGLIIANSKNAAQNATLNGQRISSFTDGDFSQGGWPAFVSLSTEPQNNVYGAYLTADSELSLRVAGANMRQKDEISTGKGFLSWRDPKCKKEVKDHNAQVKSNYEASSEEAYYESLENGTGEGYYGGEVGTIRSVESCPIKTPGSTIQESLQNNLNGPLRELELADEIDEIVNALFAQLVKMVLQKGLGAVSGGGPSDSGSYLREIQNESQGSNATQLGGLKNEFITSVEKYIKDILEYKKYKDQSLNLLLDVQTTYDNAKACYSQKINATPPPSSTQISVYQSKITEIDSEAGLVVTPLAAQLFSEVRAADSRHTSMVSLKTRGAMASTTNDLRGPADELSQIIRQRNYYDSRDIVSAQQQLSELQGTVPKYKENAFRRVQECQISTGSVIQ
jgi:hypothetical protein